MVEYHLLDVIVSVFNQGMDLGKECEECQERGRFDFEPVVWMEPFREVAGYRS